MLKSPVTTTRCEYAENFSPTWMKLADGKFHLANAKDGDTSDHEHGPAVKRLIAVDHGDPIAKTPYH